MPEYHLPVTGPVEGGVGYFQLDDFTRGYIEAMFFTDCSSADDGELEGMGYADLHADTLTNIIADCQSFQKVNERLLRLAVQWAERKGIAYDMERAGNDFWYTRNGHGVGYWDRGLGVIGDRLSDACGWRTPYGQRDVYLGDDGKVHLS